MKKPPQSVHSHLDAGRLNLRRRLAPLRIKKRWSGFMVVDGLREWQLPLPKDLAYQVVARNARSMPEHIRERLVQDLASEDWTERCEMRA